MKKYLKICIFILIICFFVITNVLADTKTMTIIDMSDTNENYGFNNDKGIITQKIIDIDNENREITVETTIQNKQEELTENEVIFVIDGSLSTAYTSNHEDLYYSRYLELSKKIAQEYIENHDDVKVGAVFAYGRKYDFDYDKMINCDTDEPEFYDVNVVPEYSTPVEIAPRVAINPTSDLDAFNTAINNMENVPTELGFSWQTKVLTNLQAGIKKAEETFSNSAKSKTIIIISDGIITEDADENYFGPAEYPFYNYYDSELWEEKNIGESNTQIVYSNTMTYDDIDSLRSLIYTNTINEINNLKNKGYNVENIICGYDNDEDEFVDEGDDWGDWDDWDDEESSDPLYTYANLLNFSNLSNHNLSKYEKIQPITDTILSNYNELDSSSINTTKVDLDIVLSKELLKNYELVKVGTPTLGTAKSNDNKDTVIWNIEDLPNDEVNSLIFKLKLKDDYDKEAAAQITKISEKISVVLDYNVDEIVPNPAVRVEENVLSDDIENGVEENKITENKQTDEQTEKVVEKNPKTGDVIRRHFSMFAIGLGILSFATFAIKYGTKKNNIIF